MNGQSRCLVGVKAIAAFVGVGRRTVERWLADESSGIPAFRLGGRWRADAEKMQEWSGRPVDK